ncbi:MAG: Type 1 glutamine amidotransferase-like domain-containing protein [Clostridia bacterium]|nr:Type 1 glutamine amidotransferase-like domain-containing protein [Clostridia bacterium]
MFPNGFNEQTEIILREKIDKRKKFAFIASEFHKNPEKTEKYFRYFMNMFEKADIIFEEKYVIDGRVSIEEAQKLVTEADVIWLSGGNTPVEFHYLQEYGLDSVIKQHSGVIIGMSAGSINLAKTAICTLSCGHTEQTIYNGIGCVDISVEPHFVREKVADELIELSQKYTIYGLCDESIIVCSGKTVEFYGEIYRLTDRNIENISI